MSATETRADFAVRDEGSLILLWPISDEAEAWISENLPEDAPMWCHAVVIERRYAHDIIDAMSAEGLTGRRT